MAIPPTSAAPEVLYDVDGHVATITLNRPHRRNAISVQMLVELTEVIERIERDRGVRVAILTGAGAGFCSGLDIKDAMAGTGIGGGGNVSPGGAGLSRTTDLPTIALHEMNTPVIAALNGAAAGYGLDLALGCDLRLAAESARLLPGFAKRAIVPESGGTWYLPRLVGWAKAAEIAYLGRDLTAAESQELGLVNAVVPDEQLMGTANDWAGEIAANAPLAVQSIKRLFRAGMNEDFRTHSEHVLLQLTALMRTQDFQEGLLSFMEHRAPDFTGR
ncbi:MAG: enoyl-CoA hydratase/isomerase family protein [Acidimicrobiia bacterium]|nr:enoyl-CoA hydratase/isomerase family protein [Acidimicrobiia bacterium]